MKRNGEVGLIQGGLVNILSGEDFNLTNEGAMESSTDVQCAETV